MTRYQHVLAVACPLAASTALVFSGAAVGATASGLPYGPGPQAHYTVQKQPAPGTCHYSSYKSQPLPDRHCTPGALNPKVTTSTLKATICNPHGYTSKIRPPASVTGREKVANARSYGFKTDKASLHDAEYDHLVSLQLGGDPNDPRNLWIEPPSPGHTPGAGPNNDKTHLHTAICNGSVTLAAAQKAIATNWVTAETKLGLK